MDTTDEDEPVDSAAVEREAARDAEPVESAAREAEPVAIAEAHPADPRGQALEADPLGRHVS